MSSKLTPSGNGIRLWWLLLVEALLPVLRAKIQNDYFLHDDPVVCCVRLALSYTNYKPLDRFAMAAATKSRNSG